MNSSTASANKRLREICISRERASTCSKSGFSSDIAVFTLAMSLYHSSYPKYNFSQGPCQVGRCKGWYGSCKPQERLRGAMELPCCHWQSRPITTQRTIRLEE